jgi:hypothetical protein
MKEKLKVTIRDSAHWVCPEDKDIVQINVNKASEILEKLIEEKACKFSEWMSSLIISNYKSGGNWYMTDHTIKSSEFLFKKFLEQDS